MAPSQAAIEQTLAHPIDLVSRFVARQDWMLCQQEPDALIAEIPGRWSQYQLAVSWQDTEETMQVVCRIDLKAGGAQVAPARGRFWRRRRPRGRPAAGCRSS